MRDVEPHPGLARKVSRVRQSYYSGDDLAADSHELNGIQAAKYAVRAASAVLELLILLIIAGPIVGAVSPMLGSQQQPLGVGVDLNSVQPPMGFFNSSSTVVGNHSRILPAFTR